MLVPLVVEKIGGSASVVDRVTTGRIIIEWRS
jgi:hypothetical protein